MAAVNFTFEPHNDNDPFDDIRPGDILTLEHPSGAKLADVKVLPYKVIGELGSLGLSHIASQGWGVRSVIREAHFEPGVYGRPGVVGVLRPEDIFSATPTTMTHLLSGDDVTHEATMAPAWKNAVPLSHVSEVADVVLREVRGELRTDDPTVHGAIDRVARRYDRS
jgi:hypothetical protein